MSIMTCPLSFVTKLHMWSLCWATGMRDVKVYLNHPGHMTAIAAMCIIVKPLKFFFSRVSRLKTRELGIQHWVLKCYQSKWWPLVDWTNCIFKSVNAIWYLNMWMQFAPKPHYCRKRWTNLSWIHFQLTCSKAQEELQLLLWLQDPTLR